MSETDQGPDMGMRGTEVTGHGPQEWRRSRSLSEGTEIEQDPSPQEGFGGQ